MTPTGAYTEFGSFFAPEQITVGPDNNIWFVTFGSNLVVKVTP